MAEVVLQRVHSPSFVSAMATGVTLAGPSPDGFYHVTFWREGVRVNAEAFDQVTLPDGAVALTPTADSIRHEMFREEVATILVPVDKISAVGLTFQRATDPDQKASPVPVVGAPAR